MNSGALLVIVTGPPGAGKTTIARELGARLSLPVLHKDDLKEAIVDAIGAPDVAASQRAGQATYAALFISARAMLKAGASVIVESNFRRGLSEEGLSVLAGCAAAAVIVQCEVPVATAVERYRQRIGIRHRAHFDAERIADVQIAAADRSHYDLDLAASLIRVDTSGPSPRPSIAEIAHAIRP